MLCVRQRRDCFRRLTTRSVAFSIACRSAVLATLVPAVVACHESIGPEALGVRLDVEPTTAVISSGQQGQIVWRVHNLTNGMVSLTFPSSCQALLHFEPVGSGTQVIWPSGCRDVLSTLTLEAFAEHAETVSVARGPQVGYAPEVALELGSYAVYATMIDTSRQFSVRSRAVFVTVE